MMANSELERFVQAIADDHGLATGIKTLGSHYDIVAYANIRGYAITLAEWGRYLAMDWLQTSDADLASVHRPIQPIGAGRSVNCPAGGRC